MPRQEGMYQHCKAVHDGAESPGDIYNMPGRSVVDMTVETMARLAELPRIVGVKDATADLVRPIKTRMAIGPDFTQLSGEDASIVPYLAHGGHGCISATANVAPKLLSELHLAWQRRELDTVFTINERLQPLHEALFCETSPGRSEEHTSELQSLMRISYAGFCLKKKKKHSHLKKVLFFLQNNNTVHNITVTSFNIQHVPV